MMLCNEHLASDHKKYTRPFSILGLDVFLTSFGEFEILPGFYQGSQCFICNLLILLIKKWWRRRELNPKANWKTSQ